jgi:hypothetical protein
MKNNNVITDWSKYKRLFAFGCSFTQYGYPTWSYIIHKSLDESVPFYNLGRSGGGNLFIANRLTEANRRFKFTDTDLVLLMWSTFCRFDLYTTERRWITSGNIYTQNELSQSLVREIDSPVWFLMRDMSVIDLTTEYLDNLPCDVIKFMAVGPDYNSFQNIEEDNTTKSIIETYSHIKDIYPTPLFDFMGQKWSSELVYKKPDGESFTDYHPTPKQYSDYLLHCKIPITERSIWYANDAYYKIKNEVTTSDDLSRLFPECYDTAHEAYKIAW